MTFGEWLLAGICAWWVTYTLGGWPPVPAWLGARMWLRWRNRLEAGGWSACAWTEAPVSRMVSTVGDDDELPAVQVVREFGLTTEEAARRLRANAALAAWDFGPQVDSSAGSAVAVDVPAGA